MLIRPMPSPRATNHEKLYILQGGRRSNPRGGAYDSVGGSPEDSVGQIFAWVTENLDDAAQTRLIEMLANKPARPAEDEDEPPVVDPMQTRGKAPGQRLSMDSEHMRSLDKRFGLARIGIG